MEILVGKNKHHNWELIKSAEPHDIWFHVADAPSSHCILVTQNKKPDHKQLKKAAVMCKQHSQSKTLKCVEINYTQIQNVLLDEKGGPGSVILTGPCKSIFI
jgi:predicted ribosome quality control (RQC) complex YloA/Tae2 family protein